MSTLSVVVTKSPRVEWLLLPLLLTLSLPLAFAQEEPASAEATTPAPGAEAQPSAKLVEALKKAPFSRAPQSVLEAAALSLLPEAGAPTSQSAPGTSAATSGAKPTPDPNQETVVAFTRAVARGDWGELNRLLTEHFKDQPAEAKQVYQHILTALAMDPRQQRDQGGGASPMPEGGAQNAAAFRQSQLVHPSDVLALADVCPGELDESTVGQLAVLLQQAFNRGQRPEQMLTTLDTGTARLGGPDPAKRLLAAKLTLAAGLAVEAGRFLPSLEEAVAAKDAERLNLLARHFIGKHQHEGQPVWLENAWQAIQVALSQSEAAIPLRIEALQRAMELAPRVPSELGEKWLAESFTTTPARGLEILATIGGHIQRQRLNSDAATRESNLELQHRVVSTLLTAAPARAEEWREPLTVLALNWLHEAKWSQERDLSTQRGPQMQYDPFGNIYFANYDYEQQQQMQRQQGPQPVPTGRLLDLRPDDAWIERLEPSLRPALMAQTVELFLKVNEPEAAFPLIEKIAVDLKEEGKRLAGRFLQVWTEKHDPNADRRRTNRFMYIYGYNPQADGIPLTRSQQDRNLEELAGWVKRLRALPVDAVDEQLIANAFIKTHSQAEVYRLEAMEKVFGSLETMKPSTLANLVQTMRANLGGVWRAPKVQQDAKTKRTDKDIQAEVLRGYYQALEALEPALAAHPTEWSLRLARATTLFDQATYENTLQSDANFTAKRDAAFAEFQQAAALYVQALPNLKAEEQSGQVFQQWFYAALGASDLEAIKFEYPESPRQIPLIREALFSLTGEIGKKHVTEFANALSTRMSAVQPELKHRYLGAGLDIVGDHERAREARDLFRYYKDVVTEIQFVTRLDGPDQIGVEPFGVFVEIRHTAQIEREAGGFQKYLQNQQGGYYYNFGRPPENYRDKFDESARQALQESFEVLSCTFHTDKIQSRGDAQEGWRVTPYAYLLLKPKGTQVDALPPLKLNLDFLDTSGFAVLPIASNKLPLSAVGAPAPRPVSHVEIKQILDERQAKEGKLVLEVRVTAHGLVPGLDQLLTFPPGEFDLIETDDQGVHVTQLDAEAEENSAVSERLWNLTYRAKPGLPGPPKAFSFGKPVNADYQTSHFRYEDADLAAVGPTVELSGSYQSSRFPWVWVLGALATTAILIAAWLGLRHRPRVEIRKGQFTLPGELTPLSVLGLLRRIHRAGALQPSQQAELDEVIRRIEASYFAQGQETSPDLDHTARYWLAQAQG